MATGNSDKQLIDSLKSVPIFAGTSPKQRKQLVTLGKVLKWKEGSTPITEGSKGAAFFLIMEGQAEVTKGGSRVAVVGSGEFVGEIALLSNSPRTASVTALSDCVVFALGRPALAAAFKNDSALALNMLQAVAARMAGTM
ncbi:MAG: cyclic nucleotide-binding domain-containing protein [Actinomycetota bacterium]